MGVTIESGVSIVNQYPDTAAGASCTPPVFKHIPIQDVYPPSKYKILGGGCGDMKRGEDDGGLDELERAGVIISLSVFFF